MDISALRGNKFCQLKERNESLGSNMCYVSLPSNCTNLQNSSMYPGFLLSSDSCTAQRILQEIIDTNSSTDGMWLKYKSAYWKKLDTGYY